MKRKVASPKTLLASLLAVGIIIYKIINFEDISDLLWIALFGYLLVKGLRVAFSQEAYDEDVRRAYQVRALYLDLFGKFAFIAVDVPVISLVLTLPLVGLCPDSAARDIMLWALLLFAGGYAVWFVWYTAKHKRLRVESGQWGSAVLSPEEERAWKRSDRCHHMVYGAVLVLGILFFLFRHTGG